MSKEAQDRLALTLEAKKKLQECVAALAACGFGPDGPAIETTFAEIEEFGHEAGRLLARSLDQVLTEQHGEHFKGDQACPQCGQVCPVVDRSAERLLQTSDGDVPLGEPRCHCPVCHRDFFPSASRIED